MYSHFRDWARERIRRAPSAPRYYWQQLASSAKRCRGSLVDRVETTKIAIDHEFMLDGQLMNDPAAGQEVVVARKSSSPLYVMSGPHVKLRPGAYEAVFQLCLLSNGTPGAQVAELQVTTSEGRRMHGYQTVHRMHLGAVGEYMTFLVPFTCENSSLEFEFRVKSLGQFEFSIAAPWLKRNRVQSLKYGICQITRRVMTKALAFIPLRGPQSRDRDRNLVEKSLGTQSQDFYGEQYYKAVNPRTDGGYSDLENLRCNNRILAKIVMEYLAPQRLLDVGCSMGFAVEAFREQGIEAYGIDFSEYAIAHAPLSIKPYVRVGNVLDIGYPDQSFDVVLCSEVLEHLPVDYIDQAIDELCRVTSGKLVLSMPSIGANEFGPPHGLCFPSVGQVDLVPPDKLDLDKDGKPWGGHVTVASFRWWTNKLAEHGLVRLGELERQMNAAQLSRQLSIWNFYCCAKSGECTGDI